MKNRAFVALEIKAMDDDLRKIEGWASTVSVDRAGDIVVPEGVKFTLPIPFLLDHDHKQVVGAVDLAEITKRGIKFSAHIERIAEPGAAKDLCDKAWSYIKHGLRKAVSIGFRPLEFEALPNGGLKFTSWDWYELSAVGIPAQPEAIITSVKSYALDQEFTTVTTVDVEIPSKRQDPAAIGTVGRIVRLGDTARVGAKPFVIRNIRRTG